MKPIIRLTAAFALTRLMKSLLFDVSPADPATPPVEIPPDASCPGTWTA